MEWSDKDKAIVNELINQTWAGGGIRSPQFAQEVEMLRARILRPEELKPCSTDAKEQKP